MALLLAKGDHFAEWRGVDEFVTGYRDAAIKMAAGNYPEAITATLGAICDGLTTLAAENRELVDQVSRITDRLSGVHDHEGLRTLWADFYAHAYAHFRRLASPPAFFEVSNAFCKPWSVVRLPVCCSSRLRRCHRLPCLCWDRPGVLSSPVFAAFSWCWCGRGTELLPRMR